MGMWASCAAADRVSRLPLRSGAAKEAGLHRQAMWAASKHARTGRAGSAAVHWRSVGGAHAARVPAAQRPPTGAAGAVLERLPALDRRAAAVRAVVRR